MSQVIRIPPYHYIHVTETNTSITTCIEGPRTVQLMDNQVLAHSVTPFHLIPRGCYAVIANPVTDTSTTPYTQSLGGKLVRVGHASFPLFPGESFARDGMQGIYDPSEDEEEDEEEDEDDDQELAPLTLAIPGTSSLPRGVLQLPVVPSLAGLRVRALADFEEDGVKRIAGEMWIVRGPTVYTPRVEAEILRLERARLISLREALRMQATRDTIDTSGVKRAAGEEFLVETPGSYLASAYERCLGKDMAQQLTDKRALHIRAVCSNFKDRFGVKRSIGDEWIVTVDMARTFLPSINEELVRVLTRTVLAPREWVVIVNPLDGKTSKPLWGQRKLVIGPTSFFVRPGETMLTSDPQSAFILGDDEALVLFAVKDFTESAIGEEEGATVKRCAGERWLLRGPSDYIPPIEAEVIDRRRTIVLGNSEGIYVRDVRSGTINTVMGPARVLLNENEELWEKPLSSLTEKLLQNGGGFSENPEVRKLAYFESLVEKTTVRDKTRVVSYRVPHNCAVLVFDYQKQKSRVVFGPDLVLLNAHEEFHELSLSAGKPKKENALQCLPLMLGPDYMTDIIQIETADHARLSVKLGYNNRFDVGTTEEEHLQMFSVKDWIGIACRNIGSAVRALVAKTHFADFHKNSTRLIRQAVFGIDPETKRVKDRLYFAQNRLVISSVDVQAIEPVDEHMRSSLNDSVRLAIEIATQSTEASSRHEARRNEQAAKGALERQKLKNAISIEQERVKLVELQAQSAAIDSVGISTAEAHARADAAIIEGRSAVELARLKAEAEDLAFKTELHILTEQREADVAQTRVENELEIDYHRAIAKLEVERYENMVKTLGRDTLLKLATSGPEMQAKLLSAVGMSTTLFLDGKSPLNLFNTASRLVELTDGKEHQ